MVRFAVVMVMATVMMLIIVDAVHGGDYGAVRGYLCLR